MTQDKSSKKQRRKTILAFKNDALAVREILSNANLISGAPSDEFDCVVPQLIAALSRQPTTRELHKLLKKEFSEHFGLSVSSRDLSILVANLFSWWHGRCSTGA